VRNCFFSLNVISLVEAPILRSAPDAISASALRAFGSDRDREPSVSQLSTRARGADHRLGVGASEVVASVQRKDVGADARFEVVVDRPDLKLRALKVRKARSTTLSCL